MFFTNPMIWKESIMHARRSRWSKMWSRISSKLDNRWIERTRNVSDRAKLVISFCLLTNISFSLIDREKWKAFLFSFAFLFLQSHMSWRIFLLRLNNEVWTEACWHGVKKATKEWKYFWKLFIDCLETIKMIFQRKLTFHSTCSTSDRHNMLFEKFQNNPFAKPVQCESQGENQFETSIIPGREIAAAAAVSNVILPGGLFHWRESAQGRELDHLLLLF